MECSGAFCREDKHQMMIVNTHKLKMCIFITTITVPTTRSLMNHHTGRKCDAPPGHPGAH